MKKKLTIVVLAVVCLLCLVLAACHSMSAEDTLKMYVFTQNGKAVDKDFTLPNKIGDYKATWTSDSDCVKLEVRADDVLAKVTLPETENTKVTLTVKIGNATKDFSVNVFPIEVADFATHYVFPQNMATVTKSFKLETECEYKDKKASITWSVSDEYMDFIEIDAATNQCIVYPSSLNPMVRIKATFSYGGKTSSKEYRMTVSVERTHLQEINYWYTHTGVTTEMKGYVVAIHEAFYEANNNTTVYIIDEDFCCGYYLFRVGTDATSGPLIKLGAYVTVTGTLNQDYNGLIEASNSGSLVVDASKSIDPKDIPVYAIDEDLIGNVPAAVYRESTIVSLTEWTVKEIKSAPEVGKGATLFTVTKGGVDCAIAISNYVKEGAYATQTTDETYNALVGLQKTLKVGDVVNVKGLLGNYKGFQIAPLSAADVVKVDKASEPADAAHPGKTAAKAIAAVSAAVADAGLNARITAAKEVTLPTTAEGVAITYTLLGDSTAVKLEGSKITVTPGKRENAEIQVNYAVKEGDKVVYSTFTFFNIESLIPSATTILQDLAKPASTMTNGKVTLPDANGAVVWTVKGETTAITISNNVATVVQGDEEVEVVLVATATVNGESKSKEFTVTVPQKPEEGAKGTAENPYTATEAATECANYPQGEYSDMVWVTGVVTEGDFSGNYAKNVKISDGTTEFLVYSCNYTDSIKKGDVKVGDTIVVKGFLTTYNGTLELSNKKVDGKTVYPEFVSVGAVGAKGTEGNPYTATEAATECANYPQGEYSDMVWVTGVVTEGDFSGNYAKNVKISDGTTEFLVYSCNYTDSIKKGDVAVGDTIVVKGFLTTYNGTLELSNKKVDGKTVYPEFVSLKKGEGTGSGSGSGTGTETPQPSTEIKGTLATTVDCTTTFSTITKEGTFTNYNGGEEQGAIQKTLVSGNATVINDIGTGTNAIRVDLDERDKELRVYANSTLTINHAGMTTIVITTKSDKKISSLEVEGATVTIDGTTVTIVFNSAVDTCTFALAAQAKITTIEIYTAAAAA